jgi:hypothetical protein
LFLPGPGPLEAAPHSDLTTVVAQPDSWAPSATQGFPYLRYRGGPSRPVFAAENIRWRDDPALDLFNAGANQYLNVRDGWDDTSIGSDVALRTSVTPTFAWNLPFSVGVLDDFETGATQLVTARTGWGTTPFVSTDGSLITDSVPHYATGNAVGNNSNWWNTTFTDADFSIVGGGTFSSTTRIYLRTSNENTTTPNGYFVAIDVSGTWTGGILTAGVESVLVSGSGLTIGGSSSIGIRCNGSTISVWQRQILLDWQKLGEFTDSTYASGHAAMRISNQASRIGSVNGAAGGTGEAFNFWGNRADKDESVWVKFTNTPDNFFWLWTRATVTAASVTDGYFLYYHSSGYGEIWKKVGGVTTFLLSGTATAPAVGDRVMLQAVGSEISAWVDKGNGWQNFITVTDSSIPDGGFIGLQVPAFTATQFDSFGGGPFTSVSIPAATRQSRGYSGPLSRSMGVFDSPTVPATSVVISSRPTRNYSPPALQPMVAWGQSIITDQIASLATSRQQPNYRGSYSAVSNAADQQTPDTAALVTLSRLLAALPRSRSSAVNAYDNPAVTSSTDYVASVIERAVAFYSAPRTQPSFPFDPAYNTFADWTPQPAQSRLVRGYAPPAAFLARVFDQPASVFGTDFVAGVVQRNDWFYQGSYSSVFGSADEAIPDDWALVAQNRLQQFPLRLRSVIVNVYDNTTVVAPDTWASFTQSRQSQALRRPSSSVLVVTDQGPVWVSTAYSRTDALRRQLGSLAINAFDNPTVAASTDYAASVKSRYQQGRIVPLSQVFYGLDAQQAFAFVMQGRSVAFFDPHKSRFVFALDGPSAVLPGDPGGGGFGAIMARGFFERYKPRYEAGYEPDYKPTIRKQKV